MRGTERSRDRRRGVSWTARRRLRLSLIVGIVSALLLVGPAASAAPSRAIDDVRGASWSGASWSGRGASWSGASWSGRGASWSGASWSVVRRGASWSGFGST